MQGRAIGPPRRGLALHCGGVPPRNGWRLAWPEPPQAATSRHMSPTAIAGGAGGATPPPRVGRDSGPQAARGGRDAAHRRGRGREPLLPPQAAKLPLPDILLSCPGPYRGSDGGHGAREPALPVSDRLPPQAAQGATERKRPNSHGWPRAHCQTFPGIEKGQSAGLSFLFANRAHGPVWIKFSFPSAPRLGNVC